MSVFATDTHTVEHGVFSGLLSNDDYWPIQPRDLAETGLSESFVDALLVKTLVVGGTLSGRVISEKTGLPFRIIEPLLDALRVRKLITHVRPAAFNDYYYSLTEAGVRRGNDYMSQCSYVGPAPVPLADYVLSVEAQAAGIQPIDREELRKTLAKISYQDELLDQLGPAVNSNMGLFLYGPPGNGKTTIARSLTKCLGQEIWIPHAIYDEGNLIKLQDDAFHHPTPMPEPGGNILKVQEWDRRWIRIQRPTVIVGGELVMESLEVRHDSRSNVCEAPLQMKSNCGCFLIDDFGRQRIQPEELLNRWIVPLENRIDYLSLPTGKKIQIPFEQLIIFSTNINPGNLVDEAFLRRVPYKIFVEDPDADEYRRLVKSVCEQLGFTFIPEAAEHLLAFYQRTGKPKRRCHPRDLLLHVKNFCAYRQIELTLRPDFLDQACKSYFSNL